jgi:hypothetical protein
MGMKDNELRRIYRSYVSGKTRAARGGCPPVEDLREVFEDTTPQAAKDEIVDHISACSDCAREFEFIREVRANEKELAAGIWALTRHRRPPIQFLSRPLQSYALGMVMIAIVISGIIVFKHDRAQDEGRSRSTTIPEALAPSGHVEALPPLTFRWKPVIRAVSYVVEIYDESLQPVWESPPVSTTAATLPDPITETLLGDKNYYWSVLALDSEGKIGESRFEAFSLDR